ncbi:hypothetical protein MYX06_02395 [Patescibacteria group bacterium AH-259-L05]|nr:hypothetical protein [Patescibacteria group bacterium AH-259-L05]
MTKRQQKLLQCIIGEYIETAQPVGSACVTNKLKVSSATIRNEMASLTEEGYLSQPHTSAGRTPTVQGFEYYIEHLLVKRKPTKTEKQALNKGRQKARAAGDKDSKEEQEMAMKYLAQEVAALSGELSILVFDGDNFYYTGLSYLFNQPEFAEQEVVYNISYIVDHLDRIMTDIFNSLGDETEVLIGKKNPFSELCGAIFTRCQLPSRRDHSVMGLLGPVRMDYSKNLGLINYVKDLIGQ